MLPIPPWGCSCDHDFASPPPAPIMSACICLQLWSEICKPFCVLPWLGQVKRRRVMAAAAVTITIADGWLVLLLPTTVPPAPRAYFSLAEWGKGVFLEACFTLMGRSLKIESVMSWFPYCWVLPTAHPAGWENSVQLAERCGTCQQGLGCLIVMDTFADVREGCGNTPLEHYTGLF